MVCAGWFYVAARGLCFYGEWWVAEWCNGASSLRQQLLTPTAPTLPRRTSKDGTLVFGKCDQFRLKATRPTKVSTHASIRTTTRRTSRRTTVKWVYQWSASPVPQRRSSPVCRQVQGYRKFLYEDEDGKIIQRELKASH